MVSQAASEELLHVRSDGDLRAGRRQGISSKRRAALVKDTLGVMESQRAALLVCQSESKEGVQQHLWCLDALVLQAGRALP